MASKKQPQHKDLAQGKDVGWAKGKKKDGKK
jgi:hypothetical protein